MTLIFWNALYTVDQRRRGRLLPDRHRAQRPRRLHRTAQLRSGRVRRRRRLRLRHPDRRVRLAVVLRACRSCSSRSIAARPPARPPDAAPARRLPGDRHDRRRRDHPATSSTRTRFTWLTGGTDGRTGWTDVLPGPQPVGQRRPLPARRPADRRLPAVHDDPRLVARALIVGLLVWALMRSPWGRVLKSIREDEDAARALGKNVVSFKMQSLILGGVIGSIGGLMLAAQTQSAQAGPVRHHADVLRLHDHHPRRARPGEGPDHRYGDLLLRDPVRRQHAQAGDPQRQAPRLAGRHEQLRPGQVHRRRARARRCSSSSGRRGSSATAASRCSMSAEPVDLADGARASARRADPGVAKADPILVADWVRRSFGGLVAVDVDHVEVAAQRDHRADRPERCRQDDVLQPADRLRRGRSRAVVLRRRAGRRLVRRTSSPASAWCARSSSPRRSPA